MYSKTTLQIYFSEKKKKHTNARSIANKDLFDITIGSLYLTLNTFRFRFKVHDHISCSSEWKSRKIPFTFDSPSNSMHSAYEVLSSVLPRVRILSRGIASAAVSAGAPLAGREGRSSAGYACGFCHCDSENLNDSNNNSPKSLPPNSPNSSSLWIRANRGLARLAR